MMMNPLQTPSFHFNFKQHELLNDNKSNKTNFMYCFLLILMARTLFYVLLIFSIVCNGHCQMDSCGSDLITFLPSPFNASGINCRPVWKSFILRYSQDDDNVLNIILSSVYTSGWVGIGFSNDGMMVGSSAMIGWIGKGSIAQIKQYYLSGQSRSLVIPNEGQLLTSKISPQVILYGANIYLAFQLKILAPLSKQELLFAYSEATPNGLQLTEHDDKISVSFDFSEGALGESLYPYELRRNHGALSIFGWGFLLPIGVIIARYCKAWDPQWYYLHVLVQFSGFIIGFSGVVSGIALFDKLHSDIYLHKGIGISVFALVVLQIIAFFIRPAKESKIRKYWNWYHQWVGRLALLLASCNIIFGIHLGKAGIIWKFGYGITLAITIISAVVLEVMSCIRQSHKSIASFFS